MSARIPPLGTLSDRVQLQTRQDIAEDEGGASHLYVPLATVWARVRALGSRFGEVSDGRVATVLHTVVMRYRGDINIGDRIIYRGRPLEVLKADDLNGRRAYLSCACQETARVG